MGCMVYGAVWLYAHTALYGAVCRCMAVWRQEGGGTGRGTCMASYSCMKRCIAPSCMAAYSACALLSLAALAPFATRRMMAPVWFR